MRWLRTTLVELESTSDMRYPLRRPERPKRALPTKATYLAKVRPSTPKTRQIRTLDTSAPAPPLMRLKAGLEHYTTPLDLQTATHLLRRTGFGADPDRVRVLVGSNASDVVDQLVDTALQSPFVARPSWFNALPPSEDASEAEFDQFFETNYDVWMPELNNGLFTRMQGGGLRERMMLFWHNHFVTQFEAYEVAPLAYRYFEMLHTHALRNFKPFVHAVGLDATMLIYLDGFISTKEAPNENYARELMELFTMGITDAQGQPNYTEQDIVEMARALTGWTVYEDLLQVQFESEEHDGGLKTIFGQTRNFDYDSVVDVLFEQRADAIAHFICTKLYKEFVYATPDPAIVADLARVFTSHNFEIAPVVRTILKSAHFFDTQVIGARIKSPVEAAVGFMNEQTLVSAQGLGEEMFWVTYDLGQAVGDPPNVAGWPGHRLWLDTDTLTRRWDGLDWLMWYPFEEAQNVVTTGNDSDPIINLAAKIHDPNHPEAAFQLAVALAQHLLAVPLEEASIDSTSAGFAGDLVANPLPDSVVNGPAYVQNLAKRFLEGIPWYEWFLYNEDARESIRIYISYLIRRPEFQLT